MAVTLDRLKSQLLTSGLQQQNFALFQVIDQLIRFLSDQAQFVEASLGSSSGGGGGVISDPTYLTKDNEIATLPNSRQMLAGQGIQFNDAGGRRIISTAIPFAIESEEREEGLFAPEGIRVSSPSRRASIEESGFPPSDIEECIVEGLLGIQGIQASPGSAPDSSIVIMGNLPGIDGEDGEEGFIGPVGPQGVVGPQGLIGPPGLDGTDTEKEIFLLGTSIVGSHNLLSVTHPDTLAHPCVRGDLIVGGAAVWEPFPVGLDGQFIGTDGVDPIWMYIASTDLSDTLNIARLDASNTFNQINPLITPAESWIGPSATAGIYFKGGNVGIGTTTPFSKVHIVGDLTVDNSNTCFYSNGATAGYFYNNVFYRSQGTFASPTAVGDGYVLGSFLWKGYNDAYRDAAAIRALTGVGVGATGADMPGVLAFYTSPDGSATVVERMRITHSGYVGIGTDAPQVKLDVIGPPESTAYIVGRFGSVTTADGVFLQFTDSNTYNFAIGTVPTSGDFTFYSARYPGAAGTERMRITQGGNVGIGCTPITLFHIHSSGTTAYLHLTDATLGDTYGAFIRGYGVGGTGGFADIGVVNAGGRTIAITISEAGVVKLPHLGAFAAGDKYVVIDAAGVLHLSALGPAS